MAFRGPPPGPLNVIIVDADASQRRTLAGVIARANDRFCASAYATTAEALAAVDRHGDAIMIADLETIGGAKRLPDITEAAMPLIATSADGSLTTAIAAIKSGAIDFLPKPIGARGLIERLEAAVGSWRESSPSVTAKPRAPAKTDFAGFIGRSEAMRAVYDQIRLIAPSRAPVFITGESGTGKELCAEAVHQFAGAAGRPFVAINCSAIPKDLMESEIFGHVRGAFTGAADNRAGAAERADGGTLFLDEIAEMDLGLQAKLLRFLQSGAIQRVGGGELKPIDVRIVCATNRDPFAEVAAGGFRSDLFYRLHVLPIHLPPLRERREDILLLAAAFLDRFASEEGRNFRGFDDVVADRLMSHRWPGNVRELANLIRRIVVLGDGLTINETMLPAVTCENGNAPGSGEDGAQRPRLSVGPLWQQERQIIEAALARFDGNIARAAAALEISPSTIYRKRQSWSRRRYQPA
jgi:two-component system repressor protein LuxO